MDGCSRMGCSTSCDGPSVVVGAGTVDAVDKDGDASADVRGREGPGELMLADCASNVATS